jgi:hypothetical protein
VSLGKDLKEREFRAGFKAAKEFNKDEVLLIGENEGFEHREGVTFKLRRQFLPNK